MPCPWRPNPCPWFHPMRFSMVCPKSCSVSQSCCTMSSDGVVLPGGGGRSAGGTKHCCTATEFRGQSRIGEFGGASVIGVGDATESMYCCCCPSVSVHTSYWFHISVPAVRVLRAAVPRCHCAGRPVSVRGLRCRSRLGGDLVFSLGIIRTCTVTERSCAFRRSDSFVSMVPRGVAVAPEASCVCWLANPLLS